jgi:hypothetical protein
MDFFALVAVSAAILFDSIVESFHYITDSVDDSFAYLAVSAAISFERIIYLFL